MIPLNRSILTPAGHHAVPCQGDLACLFRNDDDHRIGHAGLAPSAARWRVPIEASWCELSSASGRMTAAAYDRRVADDHRSVMQRRGCRKSRFQEAPEENSALSNDSLLRKFIEGIFMLQGDQGPDPLLRQSIELNWPVDRKIYRTPSVALYRFPFKLNLAKRNAQLRLKMITRTR